MKGFRSEVLDYLSCNDFSKVTREIHTRHLYNLMEEAIKSGSDIERVSVVRGYLNGLDPHARRRAWAVFSKFFTWRMEKLNLCVFMPWCTAVQNRTDLDRALL